MEADRRKVPGAQELDIIRHVGRVDWLFGDGVRQSGQRVLRADLLDGLHVVARRAGDGDFDRPCDGDRRLDVLIIVVDVLVECEGRGQLGRGGLLVGMDRAFRGGQRALVLHGDDDAGAGPADRRPAAGIQSHRERQGLRDRGADFVLALDGVERQGSRRGGHRFGDLRAVPRDGDHAAAGRDADFVRGAEGERYAVDPRVAGADAALGRILVVIGDLAAVVDQRARTEARLALVRKGHGDLVGGQGRAAGGDGVRELVTDGIKDIYLAGLVSHAEPRAELGDDGLQRGLVRGGGRPDGEGEFLHVGDAVLRDRSGQDDGHVIARREGDGAVVGDDRPACCSSR